MITPGNAALSASTSEPASVDLVMMDDIGYPEPRADLIFADGFD